MKIRIKGNSVRFRLVKKDVEAITATGYCEEATNFGSTVFKYALKKNDASDELSATYTDNTITVYIPAIFLEGWATNDVITFKGNMPIGNGEMLFILVEKDFVCLDHTNEDQSDNYANPNKTC
ncbi:hypothetical protein F0919_11155 [Taibaiella lutea]|uniref:Uncharacterized protein n=1 Tax=Taibaiella lutea TaxID=2608001 RepID=A0A5M6CL31_9BACT|nr:hypothetical protein [Taibaiella lutea]KAA5535140.1 hypothetical protein F0919_11155 [Taibaiella lutea]